MKTIPGFPDPGRVKIDGLIELVTVYSHKVAGGKEDPYIPGFILELGNFKFIQFFQAILIIIDPLIYSLSGSNLQVRELSFGFQSGSHLPKSGCCNGSLGQLQSILNPPEQ